MSKQYSIIRETTIGYALYLVFGQDGSCRMTRGEPSLLRQERAMAISVTLPRALFAAPQLKATITIAGSDGPPPAIDVRAAEEALKGALGVDIDLRVTEA